MNYEVVREVTQPVHGADGVVTFRPGEQFGLDVPLPEGVPFRFAVAVAPPAEVGEAPGEVDAAGRPVVNAPKADWVAYAVAQGADADEAAAMSKVDLLTRFGPKAGVSSLQSA